MTPLKLGQYKETVVQEVTKVAFLSQIFYYTTAIKFAHLKQSGSGAYAAHVALGELYDALADFADLLTEMCQTDELFVLCHEYCCSSDVSKDTVKELKSYVEMNRYVFNKSNQQNEIDTLITAIDKTLYKLKFLQ